MKSQWYWAILPMFLVLGLWWLPEIFASPSSDDDFLTKLKEKFVAFFKHIPTEKVYVHVNAPQFELGENIWFQVYVRNTRDLKPSEESDIAYVELINPKGATEVVRCVILKEGTASGDFQLNPDWPGGIYKIRAYTNWQKNTPEIPFFEKEITVQDVVLPRLKMKVDFEKKAYGPGDEVGLKVEVKKLDNKPLEGISYQATVSLAGKEHQRLRTNLDNEGKGLVLFKLPAQLSSSDGLVNLLFSHEGQTESISRSIPIVLNDIKLSFFPEGGDLVHRTSSRVAFYAQNQHGKPADIEGQLLDHTGNVVTSFSSFHFGMGEFSFTPNSQENYSVKITKPVGITEKYSLPAILPAGYNLSATPNRTDISVKISSPRPETLRLVMRQHEKIVFSSAVPVSNDKTLTVSTEQLPIGIAVITLFDGSGIERCERLVFVNSHKQLQVKLQPNKTSYQPRETVKLTIQTLDYQGVPVPANLSLSVVDDNLLSYADDRSGTLLAKMLLESELAGKIEEPNFYFNPKEAKANQALDLLMRTRGWRGFTWKTIQGSLPTISYNREHAEIAGIVVDAYTEKAIPNVTIEQQKTGIKTISDKDGKFTFSNIDLSEHKVFMIKAKEEKYLPETRTIAHYTSNYSIYLRDSRFKAATGVPMVAGNARDEDFGGGEGAGDEEEMDKPNVPARNGQNRRAENQPVAQPKKPGIKDNDEKEKAGKNQNDKKRVVAREARQDIIPQKEIEAFNEEPIEEIDDMRGAPPPPQNNQQPVAYYRARVFPAISYEGKPAPEIRNDFRSTIFWKGNITTDRTGTTSVSFSTSDAITSFRATVEGFSQNGLPAHAEAVFSNILPLSMSAKIPVEVSMGDEVSVPITVKNTTANLITGNLTFTLPKAFASVATLPNKVTVPANSAQTVYAKFSVQNIVGKDFIEVKLRANGLDDAFSQDVYVHPKGFPQQLSFSGADKESSYNFTVQQVVPGTMQATLLAFPTALSSMMAGVDAILREPYGCFEQTSSSNYPNVIALRYLQENNVTDVQVMTKARDLLDKGYKRLVGYETKQNGYEWFGSSPPHEALTAYGLLEFKDMEPVYASLDKQMVTRTATWLLGRKDQKGGFLRDPKSLDSFGGASPEITNAYIVYALSEAGFADQIKSEIESCYTAAEKSGDPYQLALILNVLGKTNDARYTAILAKLREKQAENGSWTGASHSITRSGGSSLSIETTSLVVLGLFKKTQPEAKLLDRAVRYLINSRSGGMFGSTQGTVLALKALTAYAQYSKKTATDGIIEIYVDGKKAATYSYKAGERGPIELTGWDSYITGKHSVQVKFVNTESPMPHEISIKYASLQPQSHASCPIKLDVQTATKTTKVGETVRLKATITNTTDKGQPMTMAIIGIPGGLTAQPWQLKEIQEKGIVDFYEIRGRNLMLYYRQMTPNQVREVNLDLKADVPGTYEGPASQTYLYYTAEQKHWVAGSRITIN